MADALTDTERPGRLAISGNRSAAQRFPAMFHAPAVTH
jgi:hypothetical protein